MDPTYIIAESYLYHAETTNIIDQIMSECNTPEEVRDLNVVFKKKLYGMPEKLLIKNQEVDIHKPVRFFYLRQFYHLMKNEMNVNYNQIFNEAVNKLTKLTAVRSFICKSNMPFDMYCEIMDKLSIRNLLEFSAVSKRDRKNIARYLVRKINRDKTSMIDLRINIFKMIYCMNPKLASKLEYVDLSEDCRLNRWEPYRQFVTSIQKVEQLILNNNYTSFVFEGKILNFKKLRVLDLHNACVKGEMVWEIFSLPNLVKLNLSHNNLDLTTAFEFETNLKLKELDISGNFNRFEKKGYFCNNYLWIKEIAAKCPNLKVLNFSLNRPIDLKVAKHIAKISQLEELKFQETIVPDCHWLRFSELKSLVKLDLSFSFFRFWKNKPRDLKSINLLTHLTHLNLSHNRLSGDQLLHVLKLDKLIDLNISYSNIGVKWPVLLNFKKLKLLNLTGTNIYFIDRPKIIKQLSETKVIFKTKHVD